MSKAPYLSLILVLCFAFFVSWDPFRLSILGNDPNFEAKYVEQPPLSFVRGLSRDTESKLRLANKWSVDGLMGPESLALDPVGRGPYTGVAGGRIMKWEEGAWKEFAYTSPNRSDVCVAGKALSQIIQTEHVCGRPLGLRFHAGTGDLYIADAYFGLLSVGPGGGLAKPLVSEAEGLPIRFANDLDLASDGTVYFTDSSSKYQRRNFFLLVLSGDDSGRVLKYDANTGKTSVLLKGLQFPNGVALSKDETFLVVAESVPGRLLRHWLKGPKVGVTEVMSVLPGYPDNVRRNSHGEFWVAMHCRRNWPTRISGSLPWLRRPFLQLPIPFKHVYRLFNGGTPHGIVAKYSEGGQMLELLEDASGRVVKYASEVDEQEDGRLWIGSVLLPYVAVYDPLFHTTDTVRESSAPASPRAGGQPM